MSLGVERARNGKYREERVQADRWARACVWLIALALPTAGLACVLASFVPYSLVLGALQNQFGVALTAKHLNPEVYSQKRFDLRMAGVSLTLLAAVVFLYRRPSIESLAVQYTSLIRGWHRFGRLTRDAIRRADPIAAIYVLAVTTIGLVIRLVGMREPIRFDESVSYLDYASKPLYLVTSLYIAPVNHIFHTVLVHFTTEVFGGQLWAIRLPALVAGTLLIPLTYSFAGLFYGKVSGVVAAALVSASPVLVDYSTNSRGYTIVCCCTLLLFLLAALILRKSNSFLFVLLAVIAAIGLFTIPTMLLPAGAVLVWVMVSVRTRRACYLKRFGKVVSAAVVLAACLTLFFYTPVLMVSGWRSLAANSYVKGLARSSFVFQNLSYFGQTWRLWNAGLPKWLAILLIMGFALSLLLPTRKSGAQRIFIATSVLWFLVVLLCFRFAPFPRVWLFALPIYFAAAAAGWVSVTEWVFAASPRVLMYVELGSLLFLTLFMFRAVSKKVPVSDETGICSDANDVTDFMIRHEIGFDNVYRTPVCNMPMAYYYLRKTHGELQKIRVIPSRQSPNELGNLNPVAWVFVNSSEGTRLTAC